MRNRTFAGVAALATAGALLALPAVPADAAGTTPVLTIAGTGAAVGVGDSLSANLVSGTLATMYNPGTTTGVKCTASTIGGSVSSNPLATGSATASGPVGTLTFSGCTSNVVGVSGVNSLTMSNLPYTLSISDSAGFPVTLSGSIQAVVNLKTLAGNALCTYSSTGGALNGNATNSPAQITMANQGFTKLTGPSICFAAISFSAAYGPVTDTTLGGTVFVN
ncbi:Tat pathway signal sequence domain protein [Kitasatospora sp. NPDC057198]|uniref:Tat pathway signal sequence domain protein n=1 Tax=Kitasatospora sp. NPDC057198 TaxID=3346046 RepID=UPI0036348957